MKNSYKLKRHQQAEIDIYKRTGVKISVRHRQIRLATPTGEHLHEDLITDDLSIEHFVSEGFRKFVLTALISKEAVPPGGDYCEAKWSQDGYVFYGHGFAPSLHQHYSGPAGVLFRLPYHYSVAVLENSLRWIEEWEWRNWPSSADIANRRQDLISNYKATVALLSFLEEQKAKPAFDGKSKAVTIGAIAVTAHNGSWDVASTITNSDTALEASKSLTLLEKFFAFKPKALLEPASPEPAMDSSIELA